ACDTQEVACVAMSAAETLSGAIEGVLASSKERGE
ncbi:MAG: hypothetical protein ACI8TQ_003876, partial [Planctomycetota bacterium]